MAGEDLESMHNDYLAFREQLQQEVRSPFLGESLTPEIARDLVAQRLSLNLNTLKSLDPEVAQILANHPRQILLNGLSEISLEVMQIFLSHKAGLELDGISTLPLEVAKIMAAYPADLSLGGLKTIPVAVAEALIDPDVVREGGTIRLDGLQSLDASSAQFLARYPGHLSLGLLKLEGDVAKALAAHQGGQLVLASLLEIDAESASELSQHKGGRLVFDSVSKIDGLVAQNLSKYKGDLYLIGLLDIDLEVAQAFGQHEGDLKLDGLKRINSSVAPYLFKHKGSLYLNGVEEIDLPTAEALVQANLADVRLYGLKRMKPAVAKCLQGLIARRQIKVTSDIADLLHDKLFMNSFDGFSASKDEVLEWVPLIEGYPNFKDLVHQDMADMNRELRSAGIANPEAFQNLNAGRNMGILDEILNFLQNSGQFSEFCEIFERSTLKPFSNDPEFREIYLDEMIQVVADYLEKKITEGGVKLQKRSQEAREERRAFLQAKIDDPNVANRLKTRFREDLLQLLRPEMATENDKVAQNIAQARDFLVRMQPLHFLRAGKSGFRLGLRNRNELTLGDQCSDCTSASIGGTNFWTVPTWLADPGCNFLIQYDENRNLAHKFHLCWEVKGDGQIILTIDAMELGNGQKDKAGMYQDAADSDKEGALMKEAIDFIRLQWASFMGLSADRIYATTISNTGTDELEGKFPVVSLAVAKMGGLDRVANILNKTNPNFQGLPRIYLQSLNTDETPLAQEEGEEEVNVSENYSRVELVIRHYLESADEQIRSAPGYRRFREILHLAQVNPKEAARQMRVFLFKTDPKARVFVINNQRIDVFLANSGGLEGYFKSILGQVEAKRGQFVKAKLYHFAPKEK